MSARALLARSHELLGDHEAALAELQGQLNLLTESLGSEHFDTLSAGIQRARVLRLMGQTEPGCQAIKALLPVIAARYGTRMFIYGEAVAELAACDLASNAPARAASALSGLLADADSGIGQANESGGNEAAEGAGLARRREWQRLLVRAYAQLGDLPAAFALLETLKSERLLASLGERAAADSAGVTRPEAALLQDHRERVLQLRDTVRLAKSPQDRQSALQELEQAMLDTQTLQSGLRQRYPRYRQFTQLPTAQAQAAKSLPARALLVSFVVDAGHSADAITRDSKGRMQWHWLGTREGLGQTVESLCLWATQSGKRRLTDDRGRLVEIVRWEAGVHPRWRTVALDAPQCIEPAEAPGCRPVRARTVGGELEFQELTQHLSGWLLAPLQKQLQAHAHWLISPDAGLGALPWDLLPWQGGLAVQHTQISQVSSLTALQAAGRVRRTRAPDMALQAIGSPAFEAGANAEAPVNVAAQNALPPARNIVWTPLPDAIAEMQGAAAQFPRRLTRVYSGPQATEAHLRALSASGQLAKARYLLMATHAWYEPSRPGRSHLAFGATGTGSGEDGRLSAAELAGLDLRSDLTVVSACSTALGDAASVDGQFGFAYGLTLAGNRNALLTLWPVGDQSSAAFVARFFQYLASDPRDHARALYAAKREFMQHPNKAWRQPRVWAAFVLFGA